MTEPLLASVAPVFKVDGQTRGELARDLLRLDIEEDTGGLKTLQASFLGVGAADTGETVDSRYLDGSVLDFGKDLEVSVGPSGGERIIFSGTISAIEATHGESRATTVTVFAEDQLMRLRMTRRVRTYENVSDADIAQAIAAEHGLTADVAADGPTYDVVQQWNMSDLAFLRERARLIAAELWFADGALNFKTRPNRTATTPTLVQGNDLIAVELRADLAHQRSKVKVSGYDAGQRDRIDEEAGTDVIQAETSGGRTGAAVLERALGERVSLRVREAPLVAAEARAFAKAEMLRRARSFVTVVGTTSGSPDLIVGSRVTLDRVGAPFDGGGYYVTQVAHAYDLQSGHRTMFRAERATVNET
jgi:phage protein D